MRPRKPSVAYKVLNFRATWPQIKAMEDINELRQGLDKVHKVQEAFPSQLRSLEEKLTHRVDSCLEEVQDEITKKVSKSEMEQSAQEVAKPDAIDDNASDSEDEAPPAPREAPTKKESEDSDGEINAYMVLFTPPPCRLVAGRRSGLVP